MFRSQNGKKTQETSPSPEPPRLGDSVQFHMRTRKLSPCQTVHLTINPNQTITYAHASHAIPRSSCFSTTSNVPQRAARSTKPKVSPSRAFPIGSYSWRGLNFLPLTRPLPRSPPGISMLQWFGFLVRDLLWRSETGWGPVISGVYRAAA